MKRKISLLLSILSIIITTGLYASKEEEEEKISPRISFPVLPKFIWNKIFEEGDFTQKHILPLRLVDKKFNKIVENILSKNNILSIKCNLHSLNEINSKEINAIFPIISKITLLIDEKDHDCQANIQKYINFKKFPKVSKVIFHVSSKICLYSPRIAEENLMSFDHKKCWESRDENYFMRGLWKSAVALLSLNFPEKTSIKLLTKMCSENSFFEEDLDFDKKVITYFYEHGIIEKVISENGDEFRINPKYSTNELDKILLEFTHKFVETKEEPTTNSS